ncbi:IclR family transcriptional regulator [Microbispora bryophytorum]|uniref:IclR family transcriptional regulator n=1 Tax=Microbispora bryophytorum subsp. camponoti TaxID=1677852 RepID=A0ABR8LDH2_9ACTN|nr:IclR family transcriptional regulator [Microbispora camponoti]MBD3146589.1 IclR family transcriptional regulator [Microbispora camponoti]
MLIVVRTPMDAPDKPDSPIGSADNVLRLIAAFEQHDKLRVADVSRMLGVARSTAHRLLRVLVAHGFASQDELSKAYIVGPSLLRLAVSISRGLDLTTVAAPVMAELVDELGETVHLAVLQGSEVFFLESIETPKPLRVGARAGHLRPAYATATGRVLLSELSDEELQAHLPSVLSALTRRTVTDREELASVLATARRQGYAWSLGESEEDVASVAVPVRNASGRIAAALAAAAPPSRLGEEDVASIAAKLTFGATRISSLLL